MGPSARSRETRANSEQGGSIYMRPRTERGTRMLYSLALDGYLGLVASSGRLTDGCFFMFRLVVEVCGINVGYIS